MTAAGINRTGQTRLDWRKAGLAATAVGLNVGAITLLSLTDLGLRERPLRNEPMVVYLDDVWPRQARAPQRPARQPQTARSSPPHDADASAPPSPSPSTTAEPILVGPDDAVQDEWRVQPLSTSAHRANALAQDCAAPLILSDGQRLCAEPIRRMASGARPISGSGAPERDAVFARHGARRLAAWEAQRAEPPRGDPPCENPNPMSGCEGVNIQIDLFSSRDGLLPNLRKRRE
jgi:hypothetical protein